MTRRHPVPATRPGPVARRVAVGCAVLAGGAAWATASVTATLACGSMALVFGLIALDPRAPLTFGERVRWLRFRWVRPSILVASILVWLVPSATAIMGLPRGASDRQGQIHDLFVITVVAASLLTLLTIGLLLYLVWRYRDRGDPVPAPKNVQGRLSRGLLMAGYTLIPTFVIFGVGAISFDVLDALDERPEDATEIDVTAVQFAWEFQYPDGSTTWNDLYMQEGEAVLLRMTSEDVIHSLYIPEMGVKMDVNPGMTTETWFRAEQEGTYSAPCAEWCGVGHPEMYARVIVLPPGSTVPPPDAPEGPPT